MNKNKELFESYSNNKEYNLSYVGNLMVLTGQNKVILADSNYSFIKLNLKDVEELNEFLHKYREGIYSDI